MLRQGGDGPSQPANRQSAAESAADHDAAEAVLINAARTTAGRLVGPAHDLTVWREGVRLLADEAIKAAVYALTRAGYSIAAMHGDELVLEVGDRQSNDAAEQIREVAQSVQRVMLGRFAATCACRQVEAW